MDIVLLGPSGTLRDLVGAVLSLQGFRVEVAVCDRFEVPALAAVTVPRLDGAGPGVLLLVEPGRQEWQFARRHPGRVVLVSGRVLDDGEAVDAVLDGADAVLNADMSPRDLAAGVAAVCRGESVLSPGQVQRLIVAARHGSGQKAQESLTCREVEILESVERGESVKQTARTLGITPKTVENLQSRLFRKLGARNRAHAVVLAHRLGLLPPQQSLAS